LKHFDEQLFTDHEFLRLHFGDFALPRLAHISDAELWKALKKFEEQLRQLRKINPFVEALRKAEEPGENTPCWIPRKPPRPRTEAELILETLAATVKQLQNALALRGKLPAPDDRPEQPIAREAGATGASQAKVTNRAMVDACLAKVLEKTGQRITRRDLWRVAGYSNATEFERFQRNDRRTTETARANFKRVLSMNPEDLVRALVTKKAQRNETE